MNTVTHNLGTLENSVRHATDPDQPGNISRYLTKMEACAEQAQTLSDQRSIYLRAYKTLLETVCDSLIDRHWRVNCLNQIYRPIFAMKRLASTPTDKAQIRTLRAELARLSHYFL
ncbi:MAG: hypothetical protein OIF55_06375 [Amphritea sp.]|nr:hypothetical protein [Amphritea sp.]